MCYNNRLVSKLQSKALPQIQKELTILNLSPKTSKEYLFFRFKSLHKSSSNFGHKIKRTFIVSYLEQHTTSKFNPCFTLPSDIYLKFFPFPKYQLTLLTFTQSFNIYFILIFFFFLIFLLFTKWVPIYLIELN